MHVLVSASSAISTI